MDCERSMLNCSYQGCVERMVLGEMRGHQQNCMHRPVRCPVCKESFPPHAWSTLHPGCFTPVDNVRIIRTPRGAVRMVLLGQGDIIVLLQIQGNYSVPPSVQVDVDVDAFGGLGWGEEQIAEHSVRISLGGLMTGVLAIRNWDDFRGAGMRLGGYGFRFPGSVAGNLDIELIFE